MIGNRILKECSDVLSLPLTILFNISLDNAIFPTDWKKADVCPVFKTDNPQLISNYRPISLLSSTSKILERLVYNRLYDFCFANKLLTPRNSGFKKNDSAMNQLIPVAYLGGAIGPWPPFGNKIFF